MFDMVYDGYLGIAGEDEVAVHRVDGKVFRDSILSSGQALRNYGAAVHSSCARRVP
jgi:hypothetical protein